jgi:hypothetical protein
MTSLHDRTTLLRVAVVPGGAAGLAIGMSIQGGPPRVGQLPGDEALRPVTDAVRPVLSALGSGPQPARPAAAVT